LRARFGFERRDVLALFAQDRDRSPELDRRALVDEQLEQHALVFEVEVHVRLVGLDFGDQISGRHGVALFLDPFDEDTLFHRGRELGQSDDLRHRYSI
jgi:hypothetical protein